MLADELDYVLGVDTHRDEHVLAVVAAPAGVRWSPARALPRTGAAIEGRPSGNIRFSILGRPRVGR